MSVNTLKRRFFKRVAKKQMEGKGENKEWRVLEFYSGIGGLRYSLVEAGIDARVVEAFDINDKANDVYSHNFSHRPYQGNIQSLSAADLDNYGAHAWLLSPPCQPYTRQGLKKHSGDARAFSFLRILELIPQTSQLPIMLFVENVVGFETSDTRAKMIETLMKSGFVSQEFILNPIQFGVPYSRPRYFCLAKRKPFCFQNQALDNKLLLHPSPLLLEDGDPETDVCLDSTENIQKLLDSCQPIKQFLESESATHEQYMVPVELIERWGSAMDIVYPSSRRCCCFTKSYYRYVKGTGSLLATGQEVRPSHMQPSIKGEDVPLKDQSLRYFTPREVANLHSFPQSFEFPDSISLKQRYALLGNSLSVAVVAPLLRYLFAGS